MRAYYFLLFASMVTIPAFAFEVIIRNGDPEEKKSEEKKPEPPKSASLTISVINNSKYEAAVAIHATQADNNAYSITVQNPVAKNSAATLGKYISTHADAKFRLAEHKVYLYLTDSFISSIACTMPVVDDVESDKIDIKESITVWLYTADGADIPKCWIAYDL